jgi:type II secretory pathway pseudopilin PulG
MNLGRNEILIAVAVVAVLILVAIPLLLSGSKQGQLTEVPLNVNAIRTAEIQYHDAFGEYVSAEAAPRAPHAVDPNPIPWAPSRGFNRLSWAPETEAVVGSYSVTATSDGFTVFGACDVDGDGARATFEANLAQEAKATSAENVY